MPKQVELSPNALRLKVLKAQQEKLERSSISLLRNLNSIFKHKDLQVLVGSLMKQSQEEKNRFAEKMLVLRNSLDTLDKKKLAEDEDIEPLKEFLFDITDHIVSLKEENSEVLKNLSEQEKEHQHDLNGLEKRIDDYMHQHLETVRMPIKKYAAPKLRMVAESPNTDTVAYDRLLATEGGHTGGWAEQDHLLFMRHRAKCKGQRLADSVHSVLPDISPETVLVHEEWYKRYETMRAKQRYSISRWREEQKKPRAVPVDIRQQKQKAPSIIDAAAAEEKRKKIDEWKAAKQQEKQLKEQSQLAQFEATKEAEKKKCAAAARKRLSLIQNWAGKPKEVVTEAAKPVPGCDQELIRMFRERDQEVVAASLRRIEERNRAKAQLATTKRRPSVVAHRDPGRLLQPTNVWINRLEQRRNPEVFSEKQPLALTVGTLPRLRIPSWRKALA